MSFRCRRLEFGHNRGEPAGASLEDVESGRQRFVVIVTLVDDLFQALPLLTKLLAQPALEGLVRTKFHIETYPGLPHDF